MLTGSISPGRLISRHIGVVVVVVSLVVVKQKKKTFAANGALGLFEISFAAARCVIQREGLHDVANGPDGSNTVNRKRGIVRSLPRRFIHSRVASSQSRRKMFPSKTRRRTDVAVFENKSRLEERLLCESMFPRRRAPDVTVRVEQRERDNGCVSIR